MVAAAKAALTAAAVALAAFCGGARGDETSAATARVEENRTSVTFPSIAPDPTTIGHVNVTTASQTDESTRIAVGVVVPLVVLGTAVAVYFLWLRKRCHRQQDVDGGTTKKGPNLISKLRGVNARYSRNPSRQGPPQAATGDDYVEVPGSATDEPVYVNFTGQARAPVSTQQSLSYENVPPEVVAAARKAATPKKKAAAPSNDAGRVEDKGSSAEQAVPGYRAPPPPTVAHTSADTSSHHDQPEGYVVFDGAAKKTAAAAAKKKKTKGSQPTPTNPTKEHVYGNVKHKQQPMVASGGKLPNDNSSVAHSADSTDDSAEDTYVVPDEEEGKRATPLPSMPASLAARRPAPQLAPKPPASAGTKAAAAAASVASRQQPDTDDDTYIAPEADEMYVAPEDELYVN